MKKFFCPPCLIGLVLILAVLGGYYFLRGGYQAPAPETTTPGEVNPPPTSEVKEIMVVGTEFSFSPALITVKAGEKVKLTYKNQGGTSHNLVIEGLGIRTNTIGNGQTDTIEFTALDSGTYTFFCSVPGHRAAGMIGELKIE